MFEFKHPKYYKELRKRNKSDQVISKEPATAGNQRSSWSGPKASSFKQQAQRDSSFKRQASSDEQQASSDKPDAASS